MKIKRSNNKIILCVDQLDLLRGEDYLPEPSEFSENETGAVINMLSCWTISLKGLNYLMSLIEHVRKNHLVPVLLADGILKNLLIKSGINKFVEIYHYIPELIKKNESVIDLEKNLLWDSSDEFMD